MGRATGDQRARFDAFCESAQTCGAEVRVCINGHDVSLATDEWPAEEWKSFSLDCSVRDNIFLLDADRRNDFVLDWTCRTVGMVVSLIRKTLIESDTAAGHVEGRELKRMVKIHERHSLNRAACLDIHGYRCRVCKFDFAVTYGELGKEFIHVHHLHPVATMQADTVVNPKTDLIPVCPNCHAMLHKGCPTDSPRTPDELRTLLKSGNESTFG